MNKYHIDYRRLSQGVEELRKAYQMPENINREFQISLCLEYLDMLVEIIKLRNDQVPRVRKLPARDQDSKH